MTVHWGCLGCRAQRFSGSVLGNLEPGVLANGAFSGAWSSFLSVLVRLLALVVLLFLAVVFLRVMLGLKIEQRRRRRLLAAESVSALTPSEFEAYVGLLFRKAGYRVRRTGGSGDAGVDLVVHRGGRTTVVQCKRYEENVGPSTVRELIGTMTNMGVDHGFLVTTSRFTSGAEREARKAPYSIDLVDGGRLVRWARRYGLLADLRASQEDDGPG
jgi:restriction system protein